MGAIYNARQNKFISSSYLWSPDKGKTIEQNTVEQDMTYSNLDISTSDSTLDRTTKLHIDASLSISVLAGQVTVSGSAQYINDDKRSAKTARVVMNFRSTTKALTIPLNTPIDCPEICNDAAESDGPTHVVTSRVLGLRAILRFDKTASNNETKEDISGKLKVAINKIPKFKFAASAEVDIKGNSSDVVEGLHVVYYGDTAIDTPTDYESAIEAFQRIEEAATTGSATVRYCNISERAI